MNDTIPQWLARMDGRELDLYVALKDLFEMNVKRYGYNPTCPCNRCWVDHNAAALLDEIGEKPNV